MPDAFPPYELNSFVDQWSTDARNSWAGPPWLEGWEWMHWYGDARPRVEPTVGAWEGKLRLLVPRGMTSWEVKSALKMWLKGWQSTLTVLEYRVEVTHADETVHVLARRDDGQLEQVMVSGDYLRRMGIRGTDLTLLEQFLNGPGGRMVLAGRGYGRTRVLTEQVLREAIEHVRNR